VGLGGWSWEGRARATVVNNHGLEKAEPYYQIVGDHFKSMD